MQVLYLTRRNLETLLSKLDRKGQGEETKCAIIKYRNDLNPAEFQQSMLEVTIVAVEDRDYYIDRFPGTMLIDDAPPGRRFIGDIDAA